MHIFCLDYTVSVSKSYPLRVQNKLTTALQTGTDAEHPASVFLGERDFLMRGVLFVSIR